MIYGFPWASAPFYLEELPAMKIEEPTLRALVATGSVNELVAQRVTTDVGSAWVLLVHMGVTKAHLEKQRGGAREFKSLEALVALVDSLGRSDFIVRLDGHR